jgi:rare lipoprotein A
MIAAAPAAAQQAVDPPAALTVVPGAPLAAPAAHRSSVSLDGVRRHILEGQRILVRGVLHPRAKAAGRSVALQVRTAGGWVTVDRSQVRGEGQYRLKWRPRQVGSRALRVRFSGGDGMRPSSRAVGRANVYRRALVSWYGPGLYGGHLACGGTLSTGTLGVAHKSLPCGTRVTLRYRGRSVRVPVVDRGPYVGAREFDLTSATRAKLRFAGTGTVLTTK